MVTNKPDPAKSIVADYFANIGTTVSLPDKQNVVSADCLNV
jgi:hypothetical protein